MIKAGSQKFRLVVFSMIVLAVTGCATQMNVELPAVTETPASSRLPGKIIWHDLLTTDLEGSKQFYSGLFGWEFESLPLRLGFGQSSEYVLIRHDGKLIGGMVDVSRLDGTANSSQWVVLMSVADVDAAANRVKISGGTILTPPTDLNERGKIAVVTDSDGALFAILETRDGDPEDREPAAGEFMWDEVWTSNVDAAMDFYRQVTPMQPVSKDLGSVNYRGLQSQGRPRIGMLQNPMQDKGLEPTWVSYVRVADMSLLDRVAELGGEVLMDAEPRDIGGEVAIVAGPSGAGLALQTWDKQQ